MEHITQFIAAAVETWIGSLEQSGYLGIFVLMAVESSFIPFPSEVVMLPAGALAATGKLSLWGVLLAGTLGSLAGGLFNYFFALWLGRAFLLRYGRYFFVPADKLELAEKHWAKHGELATFVCRLLPVIRQLISLPAGLARMNLARFCLWTTLGAGLWCAILAFTGFYFGTQAEELWKSHQTEIVLALMAGAALVVVIYLVRHMRSRLARSPVAGNA